MTPALSCDIRGRDDALLVRLHCDSPAAWPTLSAPEDLARLSIDSGIDRLVLDLGGLPYLTAAALGGLVASAGSCWPAASISASAASASWRLKSSKRPG